MRDCCECTAADRYVHDDYYHSEHVTFLKVPYGSNFILKAVEKPLAKDSKKTNLGFLAASFKISMPEGV